MGEQFRFKAHLRSCRDAKADTVTVASIPYVSVRAGIQDGQDEWWSSLAFDVVASMANASPFEVVTVCQ